MKFSNLKRTDTQRNEKDREQTMLKINKIDMLSKKAALQNKNLGGSSDKQSKDSVAEEDSVNSSHDISFDS